MNEQEQRTIQHVIVDVREMLKDQESGHDWSHVFRVWTNAKLIAQDEQVNLFIVELGALLHDIADWKFHEGDETVGSNTAREILKKY